MVLTVLVLQLSKAEFDQNEFDIILEKKNETKESLRLHEVQQSFYN